MTSSVRVQTFLNFASIYFIWGSTYLAIKYGLVAFPPLLLAGLRFVLASGLLFGIARLRGEPAMTRADLKLAGLSGTLLVIGNAGVCVAEGSLPSGLVAVVIGSMPAWITFLNARFFGGPRPRPRQIAGIALALVGIVLLTRAQPGEGGRFDPLAWGALAISIVSWAFGTLFQRRASGASGLFSFSGAQMGIGGVAVLVAWLATGEVASFRFAAVDATSVLSLFYLAIFGTVVAFTSYLWLNRHVDATLVSTYALVNPVVAIWLGWFVASENVSPSTFTFSLFVLAGIALVMGRPPAPKPTRVPS